MIRLRLIAPLFFLSGGTALLYQVAFGKKLATIFGATAYAVSAVLAAFMGGLALGSYLGGRWGQRAGRPLVVYGVAELLVGAVCAVSPLLFDGIATGYVDLVQGLPESLAAVSLVRALITALVVVVPTVAMGVTLPMLARAVAGQADDEATVGRARRRLALLYAVNTGGGALGALLCAYWVLPALGVYATMRAAAVVNVGIGIVAILIARREARLGSGDASADGASAQPGASRPEHRADTTDQLDGEQVDTSLLVALAFASGLLVFAVEVTDTHLLTLLIGNSAYAFGLMLAVFLLCLSVGATLAEPLERRSGTSALPVALLLAGAALLLTLPVWGQLPRAFVAIGHSISSWAGRELVRGAVAFGALVVPTTCMGLTFPLLLRRVAGRRDVAAQVGWLTAVNTIGAIVGSLGCGYLVLPALGSEWTLRSVALVFAAAGVLTAWWQRRDDGRQRPQEPASKVSWARPLSFAIGGGCMIGALLIPRWDMMLMTNGANVYFDTQPRPDELVFVREDVHGGLTSVARRGDTLTLYTNGKFQGNNGSEVTAQRSFAHFPSLFVRHFERALVIGLGTGTTLGTIAAYPYQQIDVAEISPSIVEAAGRFFSGPNRQSLSDPRVKLVLNDGRNVLLLAQQPYDLITIELTSVWFAGAANLYSLEFYELCKSRLSAGGVLQQWVQLHHIRRRELAVVLRTLRRQFEHVALFVSGGQGIVVASSQALSVSRQRLADLSARPAVAETLGGQSLDGLFSRLLASGPELDRFITESESDGGPIVSTDDSLYLEYATPKGNVMSYAKSYHGMVELLDGYRTGDPVRRHVLPSSSSGGSI